MAFKMWVLHLQYKRKSSFKYRLFVRKLVYHENINIYIYIASYIITNNIKVVQQVSPAEINEALIDFIREATILHLHHNQTL